MKNRWIILALLMASGCDMRPAFAQQPASPETPAQIEIKRRSELLQAQEELYFEKLKGLVEFQRYIEALDELNKLPQRYTAAARSNNAPAAIPAPNPRVAVPSPAQMPSKTLPAGTPTKESQQVDNPVSKQDH